MLFIISLDEQCDDAIYNLSQGDKNALTVIYRAYGKMIYSVAMQIVDNPSDAEEVLQDTMLKIMKQSHNYRIGSKPRAWIMSIARTCAIDKINSVKAEKSLDNKNTYALSEGLFTEINHELIFVRDALKRLSKDEQLIIKLKLYVGLSYKEIASVLKISNIAARKRYQRAIDKLRDYFK